jgi:hypothetical protein
MATLDQDHDIAVDADNVIEASARKTHKDTDNFHGRRWNG